MAPSSKLENHRLKYKRRNTLACGEEQQRLNLTSSDEEENEERHSGSLPFRQQIVRVEKDAFASACADNAFLKSSVGAKLKNEVKASNEHFAKALDMIARADQSRDAAKDAFGALRKSSRHVMAETLENEILSAERVLCFLLDMYAARPYRRLVNETLECLTDRSVRWAGIAKEPHMQQRALEVARESRVDEVNHDKFIQIFGIADRIGERAEACGVAGKGSCKKIPTWLVCLFSCFGSFVAWRLMSMVDIALVFKFHANPSSCASFTCPQHHILNENATCETDPCTARDIDRCCGKAALCPSMSCPSSHVRKIDARQVTCLGILCTLEKDVHRCCDHRALCLTMDCPQPSVRKAKAAHVQCAGSRCTDDDFDECCEKAPHSFGDIWQWPGCQVAKGLIGLTTFFSKASPFSVSEAHGNDLQ